jgi:hypothetical protein
MTTTTRDAPGGLVLLEEQCGFKNNVGGIAWLYSFSFTL